MNSSPEREVRANLIHLLLTKKGGRYFLPDFGTRLYQYIFDQNDVVTWGLIEEEIREAIKKYIPNLEIQSIDVIAADQDPDLIGTSSMDEDERLFRVGDSSNNKYTASVRINYSVNNGTFASSDFVIINI